MSKVKKNTTLLEKEEDKYLTSLPKSPWTKQGNKIGPLHFLFYNPSCYYPTFLIISLHSVPHREWSTYPWICWLLLQMTRVTGKLCQNRKHCFWTRAVASGASFAENLVDDSVPGTKVQNSSRILGYTTKCSLLKEAYQMETDNVSDTTQLIKLEQDTKPTFQISSPTEQGTRNGISLIVCAVCISRLSSTHDT